MKPVNKIQFAAKNILAVFITILIIVSKSQLYASTDSIVKAGIYQNPPKIFINDNKQPSGFFVEILNEIAALEGWTVSYSAHSWDRCLEMLENGELDILPDVAFSPGRSEVYDFNNIPVMESWSQVYVPEKTKINDYSDLAGFRIAVLDGSVQQEKFRQLMKGLGYEYIEMETSSMQDAFSEVNIGVADAAIVNHLFGQMHHEKFKLIHTPIVFDTAMLHFAVPKTKKDWMLEKIDNYLFMWKNEPESFYYSTLKKYDSFISAPKETHPQWQFFFILAVPGIIYFWLFLNLIKQKRIILQRRRQLISEEIKLKSYNESAPYGMFVVNEKAEFTDINPASCILTGYSKQELLGKKIIDLIPVKAHNQAMNHLHEVINEGKATTTIPYLTKDGEEKNWKVDAVKISGNQLIGFVADVTGELKIRSRHALLSHIFDQSVNEIYLFDPKTYRFVEVNKAVLKNTGYSAEELKKMTPLDLKLNLDDKDFYKLIQPLTKSKKQYIIFETQHFRKDKSFYEAEIHLQLIESDFQKLFLAIALDNTSRKKAEKELIEMKKSLEIQVKEKTNLLNDRIAELESFREATIERELRMEQLRREIELLKRKKNDNFKN
jgi:PAS domain S-box-containing protein